MAYVIIYDHGYEGNSYTEVDTLDELIEAYNNDPSRIEEMYEIARDISPMELADLVNQREAARKVAILAAIEKLTPEECKLLGIVK